MSAIVTSAGKQLRFTACDGCGRPIVAAADCAGVPLRLEVAMRGAWVEVAHIDGELNPRFAAYDAREDDGEPRFAAHRCRR